MGAVRFSIDPDLVRKLRSLLPLRTFVETGTFEGATVRAVRPFFEEIHTVELSTPLYAKAAEAFASDSAVQVHHGSSPELLADLTPKLRRRGVLYWLDAHWSDEEHSEGETEQCPLLGELAAIGSVSDRSIVLIDDARLFLAPPPAPAPTEGWPRFDQASERLTALNPKHELMVIDDVIVFFPPRIREALRDYAHHHAVDWLAELQASRRMAGQNRRLENLEAELASFRKEVATQHRQRSRQLDRKVETLSTTLRTLRKELAEIGERDSEELAPLEGRLESFGPQFDALEGAMRTLRNQTRESQEMLEGLPAAREEIKGLEQRIEPLDKQIASLGSLLERLQSDLQGLDERSQPGGPADIEALDRRIKPLDKQIASVSTLLERLQADLHDLDQRSRESSTTLEELPEARKEIKALDGQIASVASLLERLQADVERRSEESSTTLEELPAARKEIRALERRVEPLDSQIASVGSLLESLQAEIRSVETELLAQIEAGSALTREALVDLPETRNEVAVLSSRVEAIAAELEDLRPTIDEEIKAQSRRSEVTVERLGLLMRQLRSVEEQLEGKPKPQRFTRTRRWFAASQRRWRSRRRRVGRTLRRFGRALGAPFRWLGMKLFGSSLGGLHHHAPRDLRIPRRYHRAAEVETAPQISIVTPSDGRVRGSSARCRACWDRSTTGSSTSSRTSRPPRPPSASSGAIAAGSPTPRCAATAGLPRPSTPASTGPPADHGTRRDGPDPAARGPRLRGGVLRQPSRGRRHLRASHPHQRAGQGDRPVGAPGA